MAEEWRKLTGKQIFEQYRRSNRRWTWGIWVSLGLAVILAVAAWLEGSTSMGCIGAFALFVALVCFLQKRAVLIESVHRYKEVQFGSGSKSTTPVEPPEPAPRPPGVMPDPEPAGPTREEPVTTAVELPEHRVWPTAEGGELALGPGPVEVRFRLGFRPERTEPEVVDRPWVETSVADGEGTWWRTRTWLAPDALTEPLTLEGAKAGRGELCFWEDAPEEWRRVVQEDCLLCGLRQLLDSRERFELPVEEEELTVMLKYQGPVLDVAWWEEEGKLVVRAAQFFYELWDGTELEDIVDQVCLGYLVDPEAVLPLTAPRRHWVEWEEWVEEKRGVPVFARV